MTAVWDDFRCGAEARWRGVGGVGGGARWNPHKGGGTVGRMGGHFGGTRRGGGGGAGAGKIEGAESFHWMDGRSGKRGRRGSGKRGGVLISPIDHVR